MTPAKLSGPPVTVGYMDETDMSSAKPSGTVATRAELDELVGKLADRVDDQVAELNPKQREAMVRCCDLIFAAWPDCPVSQLEAIKTLHLRAVLELVKVMRLPAEPGEGLG